MEFIDLRSQQKRLFEKIDSNIHVVLRHGRYIMGPEVKQLEGDLSTYAGVKYAVGCASGTDALLMALMACNVGPGDAIFTSPFTFIATAEVISLLGATPIFVDIEERTFNINPVLLEQAIKGVVRRDSNLYPLPRGVSLSSLRPKGVIPVDLFGLPADYDAIKNVTKKYGLWIIEDAAQSFGAEYQSRRACSLGKIACTSFFPAKPLGCYGDGGMCFTNEETVAEILDSIRLHGKGNHKYNNVRIGINGRLDTLQAAILNAKFSIFPEEIELRQKVASRYTSAMAEIADVIPPLVPKGYKSAWAQYSILARNGNHRSLIQAKFEKNGIPTAIYYPKPLHLQTAFSHLGYREGDFPISEDCAYRILSLPMHPYLQPDEQDRIASLLNPLKN